MVWTSAVDGFAKQDGSRTVSSKKTKRRRQFLCLSDALLDSLDEAVALVDRDGCLVGANETWQRLKNEFPWMGNAENGAAVFDKTEFKKTSDAADFIMQGVQGTLQGLWSEFDQKFSVLRAGKPYWLRLRSKMLPGFATVSLRDITAQCKAEQDLRESHSLFHRIVEGIGDGIFIYDLEGRFLMHNAACVDLFSLHSKSVIGKRIEEVFSPDLAETILRQNQLVLGTGRTLGYELVIDGPEGRRNLLVQKGIYRNHRNEAVGIIGISMDITERKQAEEKLEKSERHFRALIEKSADCIVLLSAEGSITYASRPTQEITGFSLDELIGTSVFFWIHPDELPVARQRFQELLELPYASITLEVRTLCKDGRWKWMEATSSNLLQDPSMQAIVLNVRDISERKEAEQESRRFEAIVESSIDGILSVDVQGKITSWNPSARAIFGYSEAEILGANFDMLTPEDRWDENGRFADVVLRGKAIRDFETVRLGRGGERVEVSLTLSPIHDRNRRIAGVAVIVRDITERRRLEREVLEIADFEKHRIGQDLHDDLCQHLVGISMIGNLLYADLAGEGLPQAKEAKQVTHLIRNAVDHARILAKGLSPLNIAQGGLMAGLETLVANTEQIFRVPCCFECPVAVHINDIELATHIYRIAQEALHNAVKHSGGTKVVVRLAADEHSVEVVVSDDGVGLPDPQNRQSGIGGLGMHTMQYRARIIGAVLEILKNNKGGTRVVCRIPKRRSNRGV